MSIACYSGNSEIVSILIDAGAKVNPNARDAVPPLILTIKEALQRESGNFKECVKILLDKKANVNQIDEATGDTPLMMSIGKNTYPIFEEILRHHPNVNARNKAGETALYSIIVNPKIEFVRKDYLDKLVSYVPPEISEKEAKRKKMDNLPCDMKIRYQQGKTILHIAVENENMNVKIIEYILDKSGLNVDDEDDNGDTPLHIAVQKENQKIIQLLINLGCDPTQPNRSGRTAFSMANSEIASQIAKWMNEPEAVQNREDRRLAKIACEEEEEKERIKKRDEKLQNSPPNQRPEGSDSPSKTPKNKRSMLLAMTLGNGTLRNSQTKTIRSDYNGAESLSKPKKRVEARPWGGSKETAMFQRKIRIMIRDMKSNVMNELKEIKESIHELRKEITGESDNEDMDEFANNTETGGNSFSDQESANNSNIQTNNDNLDEINNSNNNSDIKSNSNGQNQSFGDDQNQIDNQINVENEVNQNSQFNVDMSAGHEEEHNSEIKVESENKADDEVKEKNTDSDINKILDDDIINISGENNSNLGEHDDSFNIDNLDQI